MRWIFILVCAVLVVSSCESDERATVVPPDPTTDELVIADCYVVRDALEAFAAENGGVYPNGINDQSDAGNSFISFLPGNARLKNRYTGLATAPVFADPWWPGEIGIHLLSYYWNPTGYRIVGRGRVGEVIRLENVAAVEPRSITVFDSLLVNCALTVAAAEEFSRRNGGVYASSVGADQLANGDVLVDMLPGGQLLTNPYWGGQDSPVDGPAGPGQVGYSPQDFDGDGLWESYIIEAAVTDYGVIAVRTRASPEDEGVLYGVLHVRKAVQAFAAQNSGAFPRDIDTDTNQQQAVLLDLITYNTNPYNGSTAIRNGLATSRGEVGYVPIEDNGVVVGYIINGRGLLEEIERIEVNPSGAN